MPEPTCTRTAMGAQMYEAAAAVELRKGCWEDSGYHRVLHIQLDSRGLVFDYIGSGHSRRTCSSRQYPDIVAKVSPAGRSSYWVEAKGYQRARSRSAEAGADIWCMPRLIHGEEEAWSKNK